MSVLNHPFWHDCPLSTIDFGEPPWKTPYVDGLYHPFFTVKLGMATNIRWLYQSLPNGCPLTDPHCLLYIHTCMHACMHPCHHAAMHPCIHPSMQTFIHPCIHPSMQTFIHTCIHASMQTSIHPYIHPSIHTYISRSPFPHGFRSNGTKYIVYISRWHEFWRICIYIYIYIYLFIYILAKNFRLFWRRCWLQCVVIFIPICGTIVGHTIHVELIRRWTSVGFSESHYWVKFFQIPNR